MRRITEKDLTFAIERLRAKTGLPFVRNDAYGYSQLAVSVGEHGAISNVNATLGNTKKDLYYQIQFCLEILSEMERRLEARQNKVEK
jgi:hypothetical protein